MNDYRALDAYRGSAAEAYDEHRFRSARGRAVDWSEWNLLRRGLARLERTTGRLSTVVDVPAGTGRMGRRLRARGLHVTELDVSEDMLALARRLDSGDDYLVGRIEELPLADGAVDVVVSVRLFGHLPHASKSAALCELYRVATRGAVVFYPLADKRQDARRRRQAEQGRNLECWAPISDEDMKRLAVDAGFNVVTALRLRPLAETHAVVLLRS